MEPYGSGVEEPAMVAVSVGELKQRMDELLRRVRETGEPVEIVEADEVVARLVPAEDEAPLGEEDLAAFWAAWDRLSGEISKDWPQGVSAVDAVRDVRRDL